MGGWAAVALDLILPRTCAACDTALRPGHQSALCAACWTTIHIPADLRCDRCGIPLPSGLPICASCAARPPAYDTARALGLYLAGPGLLNPLAQAVRALKFHDHRAAGAAFGAALVGLLPPGDAKTAIRPVIVPVPLHVSRLRERGYNQAVLLARALARASGLRLQSRALVRVRTTPSQAHLDAAARRANLDGAFAALVPLGGAPVVLVDDVLTTGATADACARVLRAAGATRVDVLTVGRTP